MFGGSGPPNSQEYADGMARYENEVQAQADGFRIEHQPERSRFVVLKEGGAGVSAGAAAGAGAELSDGSGTGSSLVGEAHYTLLAERGIDFDHTVVSAELRGTGISGLLANHALTDAVVKGRKIQASCWFIEGYLERHPQLAETGASQ